MYNDLAEHLPAIVYLLGAVAGIALVLFWHSFTRIERKLDEVCKGLGNVVQRDECNNRHSDLQNFIAAIIGVTNCKSCASKENKDV